MKSDFDHSFAEGCMGFIVAGGIAIIILWCIIHAMMAPDPPGRCYQEPGPNGITISTCEGD